MDEGRCISAVRHLWAILFSLGVVVSSGAAERAVRTQSPNVGEFTKEIRDWFKVLRMPGLSVEVVEDGKIIHWQREGFADVERKAPIEEESIFWLASVTKTFSAVMLMQYEEEGKLSLSDPVMQYPFVSVGFFPQRINERVQLRHVLSHTSEGVPGDCFVYHGGRYNFIYGVFEQMSGEKYPEALHGELEKRVLRPLKLESTLTGYPTTNQSSLRGRVVTPYSFDATKREYRVNQGAMSQQVAYPSSGLLSSVKDLAAYTTALDEDRLVSRSGYAKMTAPFVTNSGQPAGYGLGWFTETFAEIPLHWAYGYGDSDSAILLRVPSRKMSLIVLSNCDLTSAFARLGGGNPLHSPAVVSFMKHFVLDAKITEPRVDLSAKVESVETELRRRLRDKPHRIHLEELFSQALLQTFVAKMFGEERDHAEALTHLFFELDRSGLTKADPAVMHLLAEHPVVALNEATEKEVKAYRDSGVVHPWILRSLAKRYEAMGDIEKAVLFSHELADAPGFEEQGDKWEACFYLAGEYARRGNLEKARHYAWRGLIYTRQAGGNGAKFTKQVEEINRLAVGDGAGR